MFIFRKRKIEKLNKELNTISGLKNVIKRSKDIPSMRFNFIISEGEPTIYHYVVDDLAIIYVDIETFKAMVTLYEIYLKDILNKLEGGE